MTNTWNCKFLKKINDYVYLFNIEKHKQLKNKILKNIKATPFTKIDNVYKTDWEIDHYLERKYWDQNIQEIFNNCTSFIKKDLYGDIEFNTFLHNYWFHIYNKNSEFKWHTHDKTNFSGIYYISLPDKKYRTEFLGLKTEAQEGNILIFPAFLAHRSPINKSIKNKTVLAFNFSLGYRNLGPS